MQPVVPSETEWPAEIESARGQDAGATMDAAKLRGGAKC